MKGLLKFIFLLLLVGIPTWLLFQLISSESGKIEEMKIDNLGDFLSYIIVWLGHLLSVFNILLYIIVFFAWRFFFKQIAEWLPDSDTKTGVDEYNSYDCGDSMWDYRNDINDDCGDW
jgi:uncharacterized protein involved in cysteine biosynthesis